MPLPDVNYCIVCEGLREEARNKSTILGFYGVLPWVELRLNDPGVVPIMFLFGTSGGTGNANFQLSILRPDGTQLVKTPELKITFPEGFSYMNVGMGVGIELEALGIHKVVLHVSGKEKYQDSFTVSRETPARITH